VDGAVTCQHHDLIGMLASSGPGPVGLARSGAGGLAGLVRRYQLDRDAALWRLAQHELAYVPRPS
jgi:hypothetical protein